MGFKKVWGKNHKSEVMQVSAMAGGQGVVLAFKIERCEIYGNKKEIF